MLLLYLAYPKDHVLHTLYNIIVLEYSTMFHCESVTMWLVCDSSNHDIPYKL